MVSRCKSESRRKRGQVHIGPNRERERNRGCFVFIDQMVYKLYDLTEAEMAIVEERKI